MLALSNDNLIKSIRSLVKEERRITREILDHINEVSRRRLYADLGFSSVFDWLVKDLGYSESAAYRRMQAARMLLAVPSAAAKFESGTLNLSVLSKVQTLFRAEEKRTGERKSTEEKSEILAQVETCSGRDVDYKLAATFPELAAAAVKEKVHVIGEDKVSVQVTFTREQFEKLKRIQELLSHTHVDASNAALLDAAMDVFLERKDPLKTIVKARPTQSNTAAEVNVTNELNEVVLRTPNEKTETEIGVQITVKPGAAVSPSVRNFIFRKAQGQCEYRDPVTGRRCESRHFLEIDHVQPRALGGTNELSNLRALCRAHNLMMAEQSFGRNKIEPFRKTL